MREVLPSKEPDDLAFQALLYASGELDDGEAFAFEERLGVDQAARDALCEAVEISQALNGSLSAAPDPAYRARVRQRLSQRRRHGRSLSSRSSAWGHPAFWVALGAILAVLLISLVTLAVVTLPAGKKPNSSPGEKPAVPPRKLSRAELEARRADVRKQADVLAAGLADPGADRPALEKQLHALARQLVDLDIQLKQLHTEELSGDLDRTKQELDHLKQDRDKATRELLDSLRKPGSK